MRRQFATSALVVAIVVGSAAFSLTSSATTRQQSTSRLSKVAPRSATVNRLSPGSHTLTLVVGDLTRTFIVEVPSGKPIATRALVLVFHGADDTAANTIQETDLLPSVMARGDVIAFLQGYENTWNEGSGSTPASIAHVNDVAYALAVILRIGQLLPFDHSRVAAVGFSNGAIMVEDLGCHLASVISLIVPVEGQLSTVQSVSCSPARAESVYEIHGTADPTIPYDGGYFSTSVGFDTMLSAPGSVSRWAQLDGCATGPTASTVNSTISLTTYSKCRDDASVTLRTISGGEHAWPPDIGQLVVQALAHLTTSSKS